MGDEDVHGEMTALRGPSARPVIVAVAAFVLAALFVAGGVRWWPEDSAWHKAFTLPHGWDRPFDAEFSPDAADIATAGVDGVVRVWRTRDGSLRGALEGHNGNVIDVEYSLDGRLIASGGTDGTVRIWSADTGECLQVLPGHDFAATVAFSPDGTLIATKSVGGMPPLERLWETATGKLTAELTYEKSFTEYGAYCEAFSPDGRRLAVVYHNDDIVVWDVATAERVMVLQWHLKSVLHLAYSHDSTMLAGCSNDWVAVICEAETGRQSAVLRGHTSGIRQVVFDPDDGRLATASSDGNVRVWDVQSGECLAVLGDGWCPGHLYHGIWVAYDAAGDRLYAASDRYVTVHDARTFEVQARIPRGSASCFVSRDGNWLALESGDLDLWHYRDDWRRKSRLPALGLFAVGTLMLVAGTWVRVRGALRSE